MPVAAGQLIRTAKIDHVLYVRFKVQEKSAILKVFFTSLTSWWMFQ